MWIDRVDRVSVQGEQRPPCERLNGDDIFPAEGSAEDLWWLSEISKRKKQTEDDKDKPIAGDEDGPPSESEDDDEKADKKDDASTDIEESESTSGSDVEHAARTIQPTPEQAYDGYFERTLFSVWEAIGPSDREYPSDRALLLTKLIEENSSEAARGKVRHTCFEQCAWSTFRHR